MKVITVGRSHNNDIVIDDPYVSKTHCQIVKDDNGRVSIIDTNSRNGVYINGKMAHGNVYLQTSDIVRIGNTTLPWQQYFTESSTLSAPPVQSKTPSVPRNLNTKPSIIASLALALSIIGAIVLLAAIIKLMRSGFPDSYQEHIDTQAEIIRFDGPEPSPSVITLEEDGESYPVYAAEGQVIVMFHEGITHGEAVDVLQRNNAKVIAQIPYWAYYLIEVPSGEENAFVTRLRSLPEIDFVYPNILEQLCAFSAFVVDNFKVDHGDKVSAMLSESNSKMRITRMDVGTDENHVNTNKAIESVEKFLHDLKNEDGAVINMSFGPGLTDQNKVLWQDVTKGEKKSYIKRYINDLKPWIKLATKYNDKDFIFVKAAGNEGMKALETIISELKNKLSLKNRAAFEKHFILVSAKDDNKEGDYPNDVSCYNEMFTKADISDMTAQDLHWQGTSYASPRIAGYIISVVEEFNLSTTSVLQYVRSATQKTEDNVLTYELLRNEINNSLSGDIDIDDKSENFDSIETLSIVNDLVGETIYEPSSDGYFPEDWRWTLKDGEVLNVCVLERKQFSSGYGLNVLTHLHKDALKVDAEIEMRYGNENELLSITVQKIIIPSQTDYSHYVKLKMDYDFFPTLRLYNNSNMTLFIGGDYSSGTEYKKFGGIVEPHSSKPVAMGTIKSYHIHFAYRK